jgi:hypothetical protein
MSMASYAVGAGEVGVHKTLVAATVDTVTFNHDCSRVEVTNRDGSAEIYFTADGTTPTVGGNTVQMLPAAISVSVVTAYGGNSVVKLISSGGPAYSVIEVV